MSKNSCLGGYISEQRISAYNIKRSGQAVNQYECLEKNFLLFWREYHLKDNYVFWPDQASFHYAKNVIKWFNKTKMPILPKLLNPAKLPQVRPIENFWAYMKKMVCDGGKEAENLTSLKINTF